MSVLIKKTSPAAAAHNSHRPLLYFSSGFLQIFSDFKVNSKRFTPQFAKVDVRDSNLPYNATAVS